MFSKELFGQQLLEQRKKNHDTQSDLAKLLGVGKSHVSEIERGNRTTSAERISLICERYQISADYLLGLTDDPTPPSRNKETGL